MTSKQTYNKDYYLANKEKISQYKRDWYEKNKEHHNLLHGARYHGMTIEEYVEYKKQKAAKKAGTK